jgi:hypothetical protein
MMNGGSRGRGKGGVMCLKELLLNGIVFAFAFKVGNLARFVLFEFAILDVLELFLMVLV